MTRTRTALALVAALLAVPPAARAAAPAPIKVGAILAVTGPASNLGAPEARTLEMLVEAQNAKGGVGGRPLQLLLRDSGGSPEKAVSFAKQLIDEEQVVAILGPSTSGETMAIKAIAEQGQTVLLSCAAAEVIVNPLARWVFKVAPKDADAVDLLFARMKAAGTTRLGVLSSNTGFGKAGKDQIEKRAGPAGITVVLSEVYDKAATDLTAEVTKLKAAGVQAVLNWSIEPAQSIVLKNLKQVGLDVPAYQSHGFANVQYAKAAGAAAEGVVFPASRIVVADVLPAGHPQKAVVTAYKQAYEARFKEDVSTFGGHGYDAFTVLVKALEAGGGDREKVRAAIEGLRGLAGTAGVFNFSAADHNGLDASAFELLTVKDGKFVPAPK
jgi:branched-chain amino acid transport system substrate-binding protein